MVHHAKFRNITLKDITIYDPLGTGVILGHEDTTIDDVVFDNVRIIRRERTTVAIDRYNSFPGLRQPVHDPYVLMGVFVVLSIVGSFLAITVCCCRCARSPRRCLCRSYNEVSQEDNEVVQEDAWQDEPQEILKTSKDGFCARSLFVVKRMAAVAVILAVATACLLLAGRHA